MQAPAVFRGWTLTIFLLSALILRIAYLVVINNLPLWRRQSAGFLGKTSLLTLYYYLPFLVLILTSVGYNYWIETKVRDSIYALEEVSNSDPDSNTLRHDIDIGIDTWFTQRRKIAQTALNEIPNSSRKRVDAFSGAVVGAFDSTFPNDLGKDYRVDPCNRPDYWLLDTANCIQKEVKHSMNAGYVSARADLRAALRDSLQSYGDSANRLSSQAAARAQEDMDTILTSMQYALKRQLNYLYSAIDFYSAMALIGLILVTVKSLAYLFARIFFASHPDDGGIQFDPVNQPDQAGHITEIAERVDLEPAMGEAFFINKRFDFANAPPDEVTPQPGRGLFSRFRNSCWHMNRVYTRSPHPAMAPPFRLIPGDERVIAWTLKPGDAVIFSWKQFIGMNEAIRVQTQYSWQLSSLVFGRMFYVVASVDTDSEADGCLLLNARGSHGIDATGGASNRPEQLLAWQTTSRFRLHANLNFRNLYRSGAQIQAVDGDLAVMHLDGSKRKSGAASFLKYFLLPI